MVSLAETMQPRGKGLELLRAEDILPDKVPVGLKGALIFPSDLLAL